ncbi:MAG: PKD domain-containing protein [Bacteroidetes bacterium]|nr:MAG: PKD domain-containing protein [Bacteroidota bacterium]
MANPTHTYTSDTTVSVRLRVTSAFGCTKDSIQVLSRFFPQPVANFTVTPDTLCQGADNRFVDISTAPNSTITSRLWNFDDGTTDTIANPIKRFTIPREYTITLLVRNAVGCVGVPATKKVQLYLQPVIDAGPSFVVPFGSTLQVNPTANDSTTVNFQWTPSSLFSNANTLRPNLLAVQSGVYYLTATGLGGCTATDSITVIAQKQIEAPNAFSPNGDGINDTWLVKNLTDYPDGLVQVFNRYGQVVFESRGYSTPWNGKYNGKPLPVGTYYYVIDLKNGTLPIKGYVVLLQ